MTKSLKININGKDETIAGADNAIKISVVTEYFPKSNKFNHRVFAIIKPKNNERMYGEWLSLESVEIQRLELELINIEKPDSIRRERPEFSTWDPEENVNKICSFCEKSEKVVKTLITGTNANICDECIKLANDTIA